MFCGQDKGEASMTEVLMAQDEVLNILTETNAIRQGHFELPTGKHTNHFFQMPLALRYFNNARKLSVALSRLLRLIPVVSTHLPKISVIAPGTGGIPVAYAVREALSAEEVFWSERQQNGEIQFRQFVEVRKGEQCIIVDDIIITGDTINKLIDLITQAGGNVLAVGVIIDPKISSVDFGNIPYTSVIQVPTIRYEKDSCPLCKEGTPLSPVHWQ